MAVNIKFIPGRKNANITSAIQDAAKQSGVTLNVGWFEGLKYEDGASIAAIAKRNEYGGINKDGYIIPPRPFMRPTIRKNRNTWRNFINKGITKGVRSGRLSMTDLFGLLGNVVKGQIQESIGAVFSPKLAPYTIRQRLQRYASGNKTDTSQGQLSKPLEDTGLMKASVSYKVDKRGTK